MKTLVGYSHSSYALPEFAKVFLESQNHDFAFDYNQPDRRANSYGFDLTNPDLSI